MTHTALLSQTQRRRRARRISQRTKAMKEKLRSDDAGRSVLKEKAKRSTRPERIAKEKKGVEKKERETGGEKEASRA